jgi:hypothetical protein
MEAYITGPHMGNIAAVPGLRMYSGLIAQLDHQLKTRVIQETTILLSSLQRRSSDTDAASQAVEPIIRRLSPTEADVVQDGTGEVGERIMALLDLSSGELALGSNYETSLLERSSGVPLPLYRLSTILSEKELIQLRELCQNIASDSHTPTTEPEVPQKRTRGRPRKTLPPESASASIFALSTYPTVPNEKGARYMTKRPTRGLLGVPLAAALWRLRCWYGEGWRTLEVDRRGVIF